MSRTARASVALAALLGVALGLLVCGAASAAPAAASAVAANANTASTAVAVDVVVVDAVAGDAGARAPGCDQGHAVDGAARPASPPRPNGFGELLPALAAGRPAGGAGAVGQDVHDLLPGPEPPELVPPSPVELSILRV
ncbi:hypothetical protein J7E93_02495 [Streptomyces sp. ISL-36]|uniref:hypothetical protein n=1 Tax=Streptomyces sp. ISL-36 TaxID=2819182 RepID=UPI001BEB0D20|nr:hypothetical protein [Streptomyces sp. ISL-36]MBT2439010.1 hypothetical protein [Streptomyces sp. ISL-36]